MLSHPEPEDRDPQPQPFPCNETLRQVEQYRTGVLPKK